MSTGHLVVPKGSECEALPLPIFSIIKGGSGRTDRDTARGCELQEDACEDRQEGCSGIAQLMRLEWFRPVHCKSRPAQEIRALLTARKLIRGASGHDVLRGSGLMVGLTTRRTYVARQSASIPNCEADCACQAGEAQLGRTEDQRTTGATLPRRANVVDRNRARVARPQRAGRAPQATAKQGTGNTTLPALSSERFVVRRSHE